MENFSINITDGCYKDIKNIADYISLVFLDDDLSNKVVLELFADIKKLSYLAPMFQLCENELLSAKGIRKYRVKKYIVYYIIDESLKVVNVLRIRHSLQDENKFFDNN